MLTQRIFRVQFFTREVRFHHRRFEVGRFLRITLHKHDVHNVVANVTLALHLWRHKQTKMTSVHRSWCVAIVTARLRVVLERRVISLETRASLDSCFRSGKWAESSSETHWRLRGYASFQTTQTLLLGVVGATEQNRLESRKFNFAHFIQLNSVAILRPTLWHQQM